MKLRRIEAGHYESRDGRVKIESIHPDEKNGPKVGWILTLDGEWSIWCRGGSYFDTKAEAVAVAEDYLIAMSANEEARRDAVRIANAMEGTAQ